VSTLSTGQVFTLARNAGFNAAAAVIMTAIVAAESSNRTDAIGDVNLTETGERSVGLTQINYRPSRDKGNAVRDPQANLDPQTNLVHAYTISGGGKSFRPWSTFTSGKYVSHLGDARAAAAAGGSSVPAGAGGSTGDAVATGTAQQAGFSGNLLDPFGVNSWLWDNTFGKSVGDAQKGLVNAAFKISVQLLAIAGGAALVVFGVRETVAPAVEKVRGQAMEAASIAAMV
jgi:hypothetical protein